MKVRVHIACMVMLLTACDAKAYTRWCDHGTGCFVRFGCNKDGTDPDGDTAPDQCDRCTGYGHLNWTWYYTNILGTGMEIEYYCDDTVSGGEWHTPIVDDNETLDADVGFYTYGAVWDCVNQQCTGDSQHLCHWNVTVHGQYEAESTGPWEEGYVIKRKTSAISITQAMVDDTITWQKGGSSTLSLGGNAGFTAGVKKVLELAAQITFEYSTETNWSLTYTHTYKQEEVGKHSAAFYWQQRDRMPVRYRRWVCNQPAWTCTYVYRGYPAQPWYDCQSSVSLLDENEGNWGWLDSDSTTLVQ